jgi:hypothetical protein
MQLADLHLSDGRIAGIECQQDRLLVRVRDWQGTVYRLSFVDAPGFDAVTLFNEDLSGITVAKDPAFVQAICSRSGDDPEGQECYAFISAWSDKPILRVVSNAGPSIERE